MRRVSLCFTPVFRCLPKLGCSACFRGVKQENRGATEAPGSEDKEATPGENKPPNREGVHEAWPFGEPHASSDSERDSNLPNDENETTMPSAATEQATTPATLLDQHDSSSDDAGNKQALPPSYSTTPHYNIAANKSAPIPQTTDHEEEEPNERLGKRRSSNLGSVDRVNEQLNKMLSNPLVVDKLAFDPNNDSAADRMVMGEFLLNSRVTQRLAQRQAMRMKAEQDRTYWKGYNFMKRFYVSDEDETTWSSMSSSIDKGWRDRLALALIRRTYFVSLECWS